MASKVSFCEPCLRGDIQSEGFSWCADCEEILCNLCDKSHRIGKFTLSHNLVEIKELSEIPKETLDDVDKCKTHEAKPIEAFCTYHDALCCRQCVVSDHRTCDKIEYLDDIVDTAKSSAIVEEIPSVVKTLKQMFDKIIENRKMNRNRIEDQTQTVKDAIAKFKDLVFKKVELLEKSLVCEAEQIQQSTLLSLDDESEEALSLKTRLQDLEQEFQFNLKFGSTRKFFCFLHHLRHKIGEDEKYIQDKLSTMKDINIKFSSDANFADTTSRMAKIEKESTLTNIRYKPGASIKAQSSPYLLDLSLSEKDSIHLKFRDQNGIAITGMEIADNGDLLLCNFFGGKVLKYSDAGIFQQKCSFDSGPYGIAQIKGKTTVAVTLPDEKMIVIMNLAALSVNKIITKDYHYHGISVIGNNYLIATYLFFDEMNQNGGHLRRIKIPNRHVPVRYIHVKTDGSILYTNTTNLVCFNPHKESVVFKEDQHTKEARGIAVDNKGYIYVADRGERCVWRFAANGLLIDKLFADIFPSYPLALKFNPDCTKLYVGIGEGKQLLVFSINN